VASVAAGVVVNPSTLMEVRWFQGYAVVEEVGVRAEIADEAITWTSHGAGGE